MKARMLSLISYLCSCYVLHETHTYNEIKLRSQSSENIPSLHFNGIKTFLFMLPVDTLSESSSFNRSRSPENLIQGMIMIYNLYLIRGDKRSFLSNRMRL